MKNKKIESNKIVAIITPIIAFLLPLLGLLYTIFIYCADLQSKINKLETILSMKDNEIKNMTFYYDAIIKLLTAGNITANDIIALLPKEEFEKLKNEVPTISVIIKLPFLIEGAYQPSGWMGDINDIKLDISSTDNPKIGDTCIKIFYDAKKSNNNGWAGIYWQYPDKNWGNDPKGFNFKGGVKLSFWARGLNGGEKAEFKIGGIKGTYPDSIIPAIGTGIIILKNTWNQYIIDISKEDLTHIIGGFCWETSIDQNPHGCTIYLDNIQIE